MPSDGDYTFKVSCSDGCDFRLGCPFDDPAWCSPKMEPELKDNYYKFYHSYNDQLKTPYASRIASRTGYLKFPTQTAWAETKTLTLKAGRYPILATHMAGPQDFGEYDAVADGLGNEMILFWEGPDFPMRPVASKYLSHRAPVFWQFYTARYQVQRWGDRKLDDKEYVHYPTTHERRHPHALALVDLGWEVSVDSVVIYSNSKGRRIQVKLGNDLWDTGMGTNATACGEPLDPEHSGLSTLGEDGKANRYAVANCNRTTGRYITLMSAEDAPSNHYFEVREVLVNGTAIKPTPQPLLNRYPLMKQPKPITRPPSYYKTPLEGSYRVYASMHKSHEKNENFVHGALGGSAMLIESTFNDDSNWILPMWKTGHFILDLGAETSVAALRLLNTHGRERMDIGGARNLRIDAGTPGRPKNVAILDMDGYGGVTISTTSEIAQGLVCLEEGGFQMKRTPSFVSLSNIPTMGACQKLCYDLDNDDAETGKRCKHWTYVPWGSCYLHTSESTLLADSNALTGHSQCAEQPSWDPTAAIDGDDSTCFHIPAGERRRHLLIDLGREVQLDDIYLDSGRVDTMTFEVRAGVGLENVIEEEGQGAHRTEQWSFPPFVNSSCNGGEEHSMRYGAHGESYANERFTPSMDKLRIPCTNYARYISIKPKSWNYPFTVCNLEVMVEQDAEWNEVGRLTMIPNTKYRFDKDSTSHSRENGLGPWVVHKLQAPVVARYLRVAVESFYGMAGGLARVEVWSNEHVPRYQVKNRLGAGNNVTLPGLLMELYDRETAVDVNSETQWARKLNEFFQSKPPGARAVIPQVDLQTTYNDRMKLKDAGSVLVGSSDAALTKTLEVKFKVPFPDWDATLKTGWGVPNKKPTITVTPHFKHFDKEAAKTSVMSEADLKLYFEGFAFTVTNITRNGFSLTVARPAGCSNKPEPEACTDDIGIYCTVNGASSTFGAYLDAYCPILCKTCPSVNMSVAEPWDLVAGKVGLPLSVAYEATADLPNFIDENLATAHTRTHSWTHELAVRITGELVPAKTGWHTLHLDGAPMARLLIDGKEEISVFAQDMVEYTKVWNAELNKNEYFPTGKLKIPVSSKRIFLTAGVPVHIDIQSVRRNGYGNGGLPGEHVVGLHWEGDGFSKSLVPFAAFRHRPRDVCLTYLYQGHRVYTMECTTPPSQNQLWRFDGGYIRPAGGAYTSSEGETSKKCLTVHGTAKRTGWSKDFGTVGSYEVRDCNYGGLYPLYIDEARKCTEVTWRPWQLWTYDAVVGTIASRMNRNEERVDVAAFGRTATSECHALYSPADGDCSAMNYIEKQAAGQCEFDKQVKPHLCLNGIPAGAGIAGVDQNTAQLDNCEKKTNTPSLMWELINADPAEIDWKSKLVYGGMFTQKKQVYLHASSSENRYDWGTRIGCSESKGCGSCKVGTLNNTCPYACDGKCDEKGRLYGEHREAPCGDGTDQYDCGGEEFGNGGAEECARRCAADSKCTAFVTLEWEQYAHSQWCGFYTQPANDLHSGAIQGYREDSIAYIKHAGVALPLSLHTQDVDCSTYDDDVTCPSTSCKWVPVGAVNTSFGRTGDPTCVDANGDTSGVYNMQTLASSTAVAASSSATGGGDDGRLDGTRNRQFFTCAQYQDISEQEKKHYTNIKTSLCDTEFVAAVCALTCNKTEHCAQSPSVCVANEHEDAGQEPPAKNLECNGDDVRLTNGRCRCLGHTACTTGLDADGSSCRSSPAAGGRRLAEWFDPECKHCKCALPEGGQTTTKPRVYPKRKWTTQRWSTTATTVTATTENPPSTDPDSTGTKASGGTPTGVEDIGVDVAPNGEAGSDESSDGSADEASDGSLSESGGGNGNGSGLAGGLIAAVGILLIMGALGFVYYKRNAQEHSSELQQPPAVASYENPMYNGSTTNVTAGAFPAWDRRGTKGSRQSIPVIPTVETLSRTASLHRQSGISQRRGSAHAILAGNSNVHFSEAAVTTTFRDLAAGLGISDPGSYMDVSPEAVISAEASLQRQLSRRRSSLDASLDTFVPQSSMQYQISADGQHMRIASTRKVNPLASRRKSDSSELAGTLGLDL